MLHRHTKTKTTKKQKVDCRIGDLERFEFSYFGKCAAHTKVGDLEKIKTKTKVQDQDAPKYKPK
jgi:hypothetical protein